MMALWLSIFFFALHISVWRYFEYELGRQQVGFTNRRLSSGMSVMVLAGAAMIVLGILPGAEAAFVFLLAQIFIDVYLLKRFWAYGILMNIVFVVMLWCFTMIAKLLLMSKWSESLALYMALLVGYGLIAILVRKMSALFAEIYQSVMLCNKRIILLMVMNAVLPVAAIILYYVTRQTIVTPGFSDKVQMASQWVSAFFITLYFSVTMLFTYVFIQYKQQSEFDDMTQTFNKAAGIRYLHGLFEKARGKNIEIAVCFVDVDDLKDTNDQFGHNIGDYVITKVVEEIKKNIRKSDFLMRYGGDEFVIVFYDIRKQQAESIFERVLSELERIKEEENHLFDMHFSYGIWMHDGNETELPEAVIVQADREMYKKKMGYKSENKKAWSMATAQIQTPLPKKSMEI